MKIYNKEKTQELTEYDLAKGFLQNDKLFVRKEPARKEVKEESHEEIVAEYPNGGKDIKIVVDVPYQAATPEKEIYEDIQIYISYTAEELAKVRMSAINAELSSLDVKRNKYIDGEISVDAWREIRVQILSLRNEYNALERDLGIITQAEYKQRVKIREES